MRWQLEEDTGSRTGLEWEMGDITAHLCTDGTANRMEKTDDAGKRRDKYKNKVLSYAMTNGIQQTPRLAFDSSRFSPSIVTGAKAECMGKWVNVGKRQWKILF